jgi:hypothetical protein
MSQLTADANTANTPSPEQIAHHASKLTLYVSTDTVHLFLSSELTMNRSMTSLQNALNERAAAKTSFLRVIYAITSVARDPTYRTRRGRTMRLEELQATSPLETQAELDFGASTAKAWTLRQRADKTADRHMRLTCQALCATVQETLPRELRDMVYESLLKGKPRTQYYRWGWSCRCFGSGNTHVWPESAGRDTLHCRHAMPKHLKDRDTLGSDTFREFAEVWYRTARPEIYDFDSLPGCFHKDSFQISLRPASVLRHIQLAIRRPWKVAYKQEEWLQGWKDALRQLSILKKNVNITIQVYKEIPRLGECELPVYVQLLAQLNSELRQL